MIDGPGSVTAQPDDAFHKWAIRVLEKFEGSGGQVSEHHECRDEHGHLAFDHGSGVCEKCMTVLLNVDMERIEQRCDELAAKLEAAENVMLLASRLVAAAPDDDEWLTLLVNPLHDALGVYKTLSGVEEGKNDG